MCGHTRPFLAFCCLYSPFGGGARVRRVRFQLTRGAGLGRGLRGGGVPRANNPPPLNAWRLPYWRFSSFTHPSLIVLRFIFLQFFVPSSQHE